MRQSRETSESRRENKGGWIVSNWRSLTVLSVILLIAFVLRVFFAYGTSAGSGFALSGGSDAVYHLHVIEQILNGNFILTDPALNYPFGGVNYSPPLFDWTVAVFAFPLTLFGFSTVEAASISLVYSTAIVGALTCIPVYKLGKEMFNRKAGYIAAAFFAISALAIVRTVFSNGTESAFFVFFFALTTLFLLRAFKAFKPSEEGSLGSRMAVPFKNKAIFRNLLFAALSLTAMTLSWIGFGAVIMILSFIMVAQAVFDRLRGLSAIGTVSIYASVMLFALLISSLYYGVLAGMTMVSLGPLCLAALMIVISFIISIHRIWVISFPVCAAIGIFAIFAASLFMPELHSAMTSIVHPYAEGKFGALLGANSRVTLSAQAVYAGVVTMWFSFIVGTYLLMRLKKKADSPSHMFITMWFVALLFASWKTMDLAYLAAPMYAIGTGVVIVWMLRFANIKGYAETFKGTNVKTFWRKMIKPIPFLTVLAMVFILIMPNVLYAVDASIPGNKKADIDAQIENTLGGFAGGSSSINYLGATNFYIKDSDWSLGTAWDYYAGVKDKTALVTWLDYGAEAVARGNFNVVADHFGNGVATASNVLTGNATEAIIAMAVRLMNGDPAMIDNVSPNAAVAKELKQIICNGKVTIPDSDPVKTSSNIDFVKMRPQVFGPTDFNISSENAMYLVATNYLTGALTDGEIAEMYNKAIALAKNEIGYIGVTGTMLPIYYGDNNLFSTIAFLNDYHLDRNGAPTKYYTAGVPWTGYYFTYKDAMYETMIWKALVGMSLDEYRAMTNDPSLSQNALINGLMLSDGTLKAYPGFGLGSFTVDLEKEWWVMYSPSKEAPYEDWEVMNGLKAQELQETEGGTINYLGGMAFLRYDKDAVKVGGTVTDMSPEPAGIKGMTVALFGTDGEVISKTVTNDEGRYGLMVPSGIDPLSCRIGVYSGTVYSMEVFSDDVANIIADVEDDLNINIPWAELEGTLVAGTDPVYEEVQIEMEGKVSERTYSFSSAAMTGEFSKDVVPDTYAVTMTLNGASVYTGTFTLYPGVMNVGDIDIKEVAAEVTVKDRFGAVMEDAEVVICLTADGTEVASAKTDENGVAKMSVAPGSYTVQLRDNEYDGKTWVLVTSSSTASTTSFTARLGTTSRVSVILIEAEKLTITGVAAGDEITVMNGAYTPRGTFMAFAVAAGTTEEVYVPTGDYPDVTSYTVSVKNEDGVRYFPVPASKTVSVPAPVPANMGSLEITMTYKDKDNKVSDNAGVVAFIDSD
ncbi:MAG: glycosyltransferase family 39 protein, partial [Methanomassiliicoccaceae archaeon]|nr:glycosyltransferase family 39 protein [Methanomassiliicoccaceae archaeon]